MLRRHQPPQFVPHGHYLIDDVHDIVDTARNVDAGTPYQIPCPSILGNDRLSQDDLTTVLNRHPR
jgi:hypothetical protein